MKTRRYFALQFLIPLGCLAFAARLWAEEPKPAPAVTSQDPFEVRCSDGSLLKLTLLDSKLPLKTDYGALEIPVTDIRRIEFANRIPAAIGQKIETAILELGSNEYSVREAASDELLALGEIAYPAILAATKSEDREVAERSQHLLTQLRTTIDEDRLETRNYDLIYTDKSRIAGMIDLDSLKVNTVPFGKQQLKLTMLRRLHSGSEIEQAPKEVLPDPGHLLNYQGQVGKTIYFKLSGGGQRGTVWGSGTYTLDSSLSTAAIHAGVLKPGETKVIGVTITGPQDSYLGSAVNGVMSSNWGNFPGSFKFKTSKREVGAARGLE